MSSPPPPKRQRTVSLTRASTATKDDVPTRSPDVYLDDGNIVLVAENVAFRVHKSQLGRQSEVFRDMFACVDRSATQDAESFDGCPVVRLSDESEDVRRLLQAIYDGIQLDIAEDFFVVAVLKMSVKYHMEPLRESGVRILSRIYPGNLNDWKYYSEDIELASVLVQVPDVDILLPAAYYDLCARGCDYILVRTLPTHIFETYCRGRNQLMAKMAAFIEDHIARHKPGAFCDDYCPKDWRALNMHAYSMLRAPKAFQRATPLEQLVELASVFQSKRNMCKTCRQSLQDAIKTERQEIWNSLPEIFGLRPWEEL